MENKFREERSIDAIIDAKEKAIIALYAKQNNIDEENAKSVYLYSKLRNVIRDKESGLYLESPYYILERYSEYITPINLGINMEGRPIVPHLAKLNNMCFSAISKFPYYSLLQPISFELVTEQPARHFARLAQYALIRENNRLNNINVVNHIIIAGNPGLGRTTLADMLAAEYRELGIVPKGKLVEIAEGGLVWKYLEEDNQLVDMNLLMIVAGYVDTMDDFWRSHPKLKNNFTNIAHYKKYYPKETIDIYTSYCNEEEDEGLLEERMDMKSVLEAL